MKDTEDISVLARSPYSYQCTNIQKKKEDKEISRAKEMVMFGLQALIPILSMYATIALLSVQGTYLREVDVCVFCM